MDPGLGDLKILFLFLAAWLYYEGLRRIDRYWANLKPLSDEEYLTQMARRCLTSEYDLFRRAGRIWQVSSERMEVDFKRYLRGGNLPHYVNDLIRKDRAAPDQGQAACRHASQTTIR